MSTEPPGTSSSTLSSAVSGCDGEGALLARWLGREVRLTVARRSLLAGEVGSADDSGLRAQCGDLYLGLRAVPAADQAAVEGLTSGAEQKILGGGYPPPDDEADRIEGRGPAREGPPPPPRMNHPESKAPASDASPTPSQRPASSSNSIDVGSPSFAACVIRGPVMAETS